MVKKLLSLALSLTSIILNFHTAKAFAPSAQLAQRQKTFLTPPTVTLSQSSAPFADATTPVVQVDSNGKVFSPGSIVAIAATSSPVKAYQVPKAAFGTFDPQTRQFTPQDSENVTRGTSCLVLPEGLRGEVMKVYDVNEWDRTHPILVKFTEGNDREGDGAFGVPKTFMMHFDSHEIIVVE